MGPTSALEKHAAILKSYSSLVSVNAIRETHCSRPRLSHLSVRAFCSRRAYFILLSAGKEMREEKNMHKQRRKGIYSKSPLWTRGPFTAYTIWRVALKVCFSVSIGPLGEDYPPLFFSLSSSSAGSGHGAKGAGERRLGELKERGGPL